MIRIVIQAKIKCSRSPKMEGALLRENKLIALSLSWALNKMQTRRKKGPTPSRWQS